jgi:hypothetical protein
MVGLSWGCCMLSRLNYETWSHDTESCRGVPHRHQINRRAVRRTRGRSTGHCVVHGEKAGSRVPSFSCVTGGTDSADLPECGCELSLIGSSFASFHQRLNTNPSDAQSSKQQMVVIRPLGP